MMGSIQKRKLRCGDFPDCPEMPSRKTCAICPIFDEKKLKGDKL